MRITLGFSDELAQRIKKRVAQDSTSIQDVVEQAVRLYLSEPTKTGYQFIWQPDSGALLPGINLDDRDSLFTAMAHF